MKHKTEKEIIGEQLALFNLPKTQWIKRACPQRLSRELIEMTETPKNQPHLPFPGYNDD